MAERMRDAEIQRYQQHMQEVLRLRWLVELLLWDGDSYEESKNRLGYVGTRAQARQVLHQMGPMFEQCDYKSLDIIA